MSRCEWLDNKIEEMENQYFGCVFADLGEIKLVPFEMFTETMMEQITALYFVEMTDSIFENGLDSLDGITYIKIEF